jgi:hypothetical protein
MIRFVIDEDFDNRILRGLLRRRADLDIVRVQDTHVTGRTDPDVLEWSFQERRVLLTHDVSTMTKHAYERMRTGRSIAGIVEVPQSLAIGKAIEDILTIAMATSIQEFENQIQYLPL